MVWIIGHSRGHKNGTNQLHVMSFTQKGLIPHFRIDSRNENLRHDEPLEIFSLILNDFHSVFFFLFASILGSSHIAVMKIKILWLTAEKNMFMFLKSVKNTPSLPNLCLEGCKVCDNIEPHSLHWDYGYKSLLAFFIFVRSLHNIHSKLRFVFCWKNWPLKDHNFKMEDEIKIASKLL